MRFRPRFTARTLAVFVTLVCAYFGALETTKRYGVAPGPSPFLRSLAYSPAPFIVREREYPVDSPFSSPICVYYLWLFGPKIKLPLESEWKQFSEFQNAYGCFYWRTCLTRVIGIGSSSFHF